MEHWVLESIKVTDYFWRCSTKPPGHNLVEIPLPDHFIQLPAKTTRQYHPKRCYALNANTNRYKDFFSKHGPLVEQLHFRNPRPANCVQIYKQILGTAYMNPSWLQTWQFPVNSFKRLTGEGLTRAGVIIRILHVKGPLLSTFSVILVTFCCE